MVLQSVVLLKHEELVEVEMMHGEDLQVVRLSDLVLIIESRMRELFILSIKKFMNTNYKSL